jgi:hypothetical protein
MAVTSDFALAFWLATKVIKTESTHESISMLSSVPVGLIDLMIDGEVLFTTSSVAFIRRIDRVEINTSSISLIALRAITTFL